MPKKGKSGEKPKDPMEQTIVLKHFDMYAKTEINGKEGRTYVLLFAVLKNEHATMAQIQMYYFKNLYKLLKENGGQSPLAFSVYDFMAFEVMPSYEEDGSLIRKGMQITYNKKGLNEEELAVGRKLFGQAIGQKELVKEPFLVSKDDDKDVSCFGGSALKCGNCNKNDTESVLLTCTGCKTAKYCNAECQAAHWLFHKPNCVPPSAIPANQMPLSKAALRHAHSQHFCGHPKCGKSSIVMDRGATEEHFVVKCPHCKVHYCSKEHRTEDEAAHLQVCKGLKKKSEA
jgi:hypothetical protein